MTTLDLSIKNASEILDIIKNNQGEKDYLYEANVEIVNRWRRAEDIDLLVNLINSENSKERVLASNYISEIDREITELNGAILKMATDVIPGCRKSFVDYILNSAYFDMEVAKALAKCLSDLDLYVRVAVIKWAVITPHENFEIFGKLVESGFGLQVATFRNYLSKEFWDKSNINRALRGLEIIRRVRKKDDFKIIRSEIKEEDSFIFDSIEFSNSRRERLLQWRTSREARLSDI